MQKFLALLTFAFVTTLSFAQQNRNWDKPMELQRCSVSVKADLFTATTFIEMEFFNPNNQEIEGLYRFQLQPGQAVTALQLDLFGKLRDGTIEEKWKAANAYNTIVGKRVDPALLQMDSYNNYSLRIYPIPAKGTRRITMTIQQMLKAEGEVINYHLPVTTKDKIREFKVAIAVNHTATKAFINDGLLKGHGFEQNSASQDLGWDAYDATWEKPLSFSILLPRQDAVCVKAEKEKTFFALRHFSTTPRTASLRPKTIAVYWDVSFSGSKRDTEKEISFLKQYAAYYGITDFYIIPFNYKAKAFTHFRLQEGNSWISYLRSLNYEGATQIGTLDFATVKADAIFLVSDGYNSLGAAVPKSKDQTIFCLHASSIADNPTLNAIIGKSGGKNIDLQKQTISEAVRSAGVTEKVLLDIRSASGKTLIDLEEHDERTGASFLAGTTVEGDSLFFDYGNNGHIAATEKVVLRSSAACSHTVISKLPALARFDGLLKKAHWQDLLFFGKDEKFVTYNTSFLVLEKVEDYVKFNIEPPKELKEECEKLQPGFLVRNKDQKREERLRQRQQHNQFEILTSVANQYNQRISKWGSTESIILREPDVDKANVFAKESKAKEASGANGNLFGSSAGIVGDANLSEVVVVGHASARKRQMTGAATIIRGGEIFGSATSVEQALSGRVPGLMITPSSGYLSPGTGGTLRIRGLSSLHNNGPLYVLDGMPIGGDANGIVNINDYINVNDIEQIEVLKDVGATALYGSRGANGVILIKPKKGKNNYWYDNPSSYKLSSMEDVEYLQEIKEVEKSQKWAKYKELQLLHQDNATFYLDMAQHLYENGYREEAKVVLTTAAEVLPNNLSVQRTIAFFLEKWGEWNEAIVLYEELLKSSPNNPMAYWDLALAYSQSGQYQKAIDILYQGIRYDNETYENGYALQKEMLLNELNAIAAAHKGELDLTDIPGALIKPLPVDLRIVIHGSGSNVYGATVVEPNGKESKEWQPQTSNGGFFTQHYAYDRSTKEYQIKQAPKGKYKVRVRYYDYNTGSKKQPGVIKVVVYKNFGKANQTMTIQNIMMDNQRGDIEIAEVKL
jgi:TonB-dependent SusC/RagA subfamily outer membrane receptor